MVGGHHAVRLAGLGHEVDQQDDRRLRLGHRLADAGNQQVGEDRGVERAGAEEDQVRLLQRRHRLGKGRRRRRVDLHRRQLLGRQPDRRLALVLPARDAPCPQPHVGQRGGKDLAAHREDRLGGENGLVEIPRDAGQRRQEQVAEGVADQPAAVGEAVLEEAGEQVLIVGEGGDAVADISGRRDSELLAQPAGGAAVVGDGDDTRQLAQAVRAHVVLQPAQQHRQAGAAADRDQGLAAPAAAPERHRHRRRRLR